MIHSFRHPGLKELYETGSSRRVPPKLVKRIVNRLDAIQAAQTMVDLHQPGFEFHRLVPTERYAIKVSGPWRITFEWLGGFAVAVDLEQYH